MFKQQSWIGRQGDSIERFINVAYIYGAPKNFRRNNDSHAFTICFVENSDGIELKSTEYIDIWLASDDLIQKSQSAYSHLFNSWRLS